jgi:hypothetical protein
LKIESRAHKEEEKDVRDWFGIAETSQENRQKILQEFQQEIQYPNEEFTSGLRPFKKDDGNIYFYHTSVITIARKAVLQQIQN